MFFSSTAIKAQQAVTKKDRPKMDHLKILYFLGMKIITYFYLCKISCLQKGSYFYYVKFIIRDNFVHNVTDRLIFYETNNIH